MLTTSRHDYFVFNHERTSEQEYLSDCQVHVNSTQCFVHRHLSLTAYRIGTQLLESVSWSSKSRDSARWKEEISGKSIDVVTVSETITQVNEQWILLQQTMWKNEQRSTWNHIRVLNANNSIEVLTHAYQHHLMKPRVWLLGNLLVWETANEHSLQNQLHLLALTAPHMPPLTLQVAQRVQQVALAGSRELIIVLPSSSRLKTTTLLQFNA